MSEASLAKNLFGRDTMVGEEVAKEGRRTSFLGTLACGCVLVG